MATLYMLARSGQLHSIFSYHRDDYFHLGSISAPYRITHIHHKEHPKLAIVIISCQRGNLCAEIAIGGETKIVIRWVYIMEIVIYGILL
jgi:hypothetical protein